MNIKINKMLESIALDKDRIKTDSRLIREGDVFVAIKGTVHDGHDYIREAVEKGARAAVCEHMPEGSAGGDTFNLEKGDTLPIDFANGTKIIVGDTRETLGTIAKRVFNDPTKRMKVYGITGTNGKTTLAFLIRRILSTAGVKCGLISTVFTITEGDVRRRSQITTPDALSLNRLLGAMSANKKQAAVIEISSHALAQKRVFGCELDSAIFCNLTPEHLDYHKSMEQYLKDKSRIFELLKPGGAGVINADDPAVSALGRSLDIPHLVTFGVKHDADVRAENIRLKNDGTAFDINAAGCGKFHVNARLLGIHNVYNMIAAAGALIHAGISIADIKKALEDALPVPGRLEAVESKAPFKVFIDYAHTPNALENVLRCLRGLAGKRLICVFGCGGDRDRTKRPVMGEIAARFCDHVILTSDNPRKEDPEEILAEIEKDVLGKNNYSIITLRKEAIRKSLEIAAENDMVVIAGKGHEDYQIIGDRVIPFDDKEVAGRILGEIGY